MQRRSVRHALRMTRRIIVMPSIVANEVLLLQSTHNALVREQNAHGMSDHPFPITWAKTAIVHHARDVAENVGKKIHQVSLTTRTATVDVDDVRKFSQNHVCAIPHHLQARDICCVKHGDKCINHGPRHGHVKPYHLGQLVQSSHHGRWQNAFIIMFKK